jgi:hypothetical protein
MKIFILLCKYEEQSKLLELIKEGAPLFSFGIEPFPCQVPKFSPLTLEGCSEWGKVWPISYHKYIL